MGDLYCKNTKCREPWDAYGVRHHEDMTEEEASLFLEGKGCPSCHFGTDRAQGQPGILAQAVQKHKLERGVGVVNDLCRALRNWYLDDRCIADGTGVSACGHCWAEYALEQADTWLSEVLQEEE